MIKKILQSSMLLLFANIFGRLAIFITNILAARLLPQEQFGQFTMIRNSVGLIESVLTGAFGMVAVKKTAEYRDDPQKLSNIILTIFIINSFFALIAISIIIFNIDYIIDRFFINTIFIRDGLLISTILLLFSVLSITSQKLFIGLEYYKENAILSFYISLISVFVSVSILFYFHNIYSILFTIIFYFSLDFIVKLFFIRKKVNLANLNIKELRRAIKNFFTFSYPLLISFIIIGFSFWYSRVILIKETNGYSDLAIYDAAYQWLTIIMIITGATTSVALSMLSSSQTSSKKRVLLSNIVVNLIISSIIASIFIFFSIEIMSIYGTDYIKGNKILIILAITSIFFTLSSLLNNYILSLDYKWIILFNALLSAITLFFVLNYYIELEVYALAYSLLSFYIMSSVIYIIYILLLPYFNKKEKK